MVGSRSRCSLHRDPAFAFPPIAAKQTFKPPHQAHAAYTPSRALDHVVHMHYISQMKSAVIPQVRVEPQLRADLDSVLRPGETLTEFVEASVRRAVEYRRVQTDFAARCEESLAAYERSGVSIPSDEVLSKLEKKVQARVKRLSK